MDIRTEKDITAEVAKSIRLQSGLSQREFWESVGSNQASGHWFESNKRKGVPRPIRILIFLRYVAKIAVDVSQEESASWAVKAGREFHARVEALRAEAQAQEAQERAIELARKVKEAA